MEVLFKLPQLPVFPEKWEHEPRTSLKDWKVSPGLSGWNLRKQKNTASLKYGVSWCTCRSRVNMWTLGKLSGRLMNYGGKTSGIPGVIRKPFYNK